MSVVNQLEIGIKGPGVLSYVPFLQQQKKRPWSSNSDGVKSFRGAGADTG